MSENGHGGAPTVLRMILGKQLQALREKAGLSYEQAAEAIYSSPWTVRRMERAEGGLKPLTVKGLLTAYGITAAARGRRLPGPVPGRPASPAGGTATTTCCPAGSAPSSAWRKPPVRSAATTRTGYPACCRPRTTPTPACGPASPTPPTVKPNGRVALRLARQQILNRPPPPRLWLVIDETALRRPTATTGASVMRAQIDRLIEAAAQPGVTVQVLPFSAGLHPAMYGPFRIFRFDASELPDIVYAETMTSAYYLDKPDEVGEYAKALDRICAQAAPPDQTVHILTTIRKEI